MKKFLRCKDCKHDKGKCVGASRRGGHKNCFEKKTMTNADRIRAMSDEELHEFLYNFRYCEICEEGCAECRYHGDCERRLADWLKQPADQFREVTKMVEEVQGDG